MPVAVCHAHHQRSQGQDDHSCSASVQTGPTISHSYQLQIKGKKKNPAPTQTYPAHNIRFLGGRYVSDRFYAHVRALASHRPPYPNQISYLS